MKLVLIVTFNYKHVVLTKQAEVVLLWTYIQVVPAWNLSWGQSLS
jgi:hypothetical protein